MNKESRFWSVMESDRLTLESPEEAIVEAFDYWYEKDVPLKVLIEKHTPMTVYGFAPMTPSRSGNDAEYAIETFLENLADEYGDPDGDPMDLLEKEDYNKLVTTVNNAFDEAISKLKVWSCERVEKEVYTAEQVEAILRQEQPDWFEETP